MSVPTAFNCQESLRETDRIPKQCAAGRAWIWGVCAGCLGCVVLLVVGAVALFHFGTWPIDQGEQWEAIAEFLPYDDEPPPLFVLGVPTIRGTRVWTIAGATEQCVLLHITGDKARDEGSGLLDPEHELEFAGTIDKNQPIQPGTVVVQGRELKVLRYRALHEQAVDESRKPFDFHFKVRRTTTPPEDNSDEPNVGHTNLEGPTIRVDLSPPSRNELIVLEISRPGTTEPITDHELAEFLAPFHVGPDR